MENWSRSARSSDACTACGMSAKSRHHLRRRLQVPLGVRRQTSPGLPQRDVLADGSEHVEEGTLLRRGKPHAASGHHRHAKRLGQTHQHVVVVFLIALQVTLHVHVHL